MLSDLKHFLVSYDIPNWAFVLSSALVYVLLWCTEKIVKNTETIVAIVKNSEGEKK
jgi:hypothetical protein